MVADINMSNQGTITNPTGKGGFGDNPKNINISGRWKKEDSISYNYNKLLRMTADEIRDWMLENPEGQRTMAQNIAISAILRARDDLDYTKEVTDRTEGKAPQTMIHEGGLFSASKLQIEEVKSDRMNTDETPIINETETSTETSG